MPDEERYERGRAKLSEVHGERALATIESLGDLGRLIIETAYGEVYQTRAVDPRAADRGGRARGHRTLVAAAGTCAPRSGQGSRSTSWC